MSEGYVPCACRDCMDIAIGERGEAMCWRCDEGDCEPRVDRECRAPVEYEEDEDDG